MAPNLKFLGGDLDMSDYDKRTALHLAASEGHMETVKFLVNIAHVKVDPRDRWNRAPKDDAITFGYPLIVGLLERALVLRAVNNASQGSVRAVRFSEI